MSYAGRVTLINLVLMGVISFWSRIFILPKIVIRKIEAVCKNFLWGAKDTYARVHLVKCTKVCTPKKEMGWGSRT